MKKNIEQPVQLIKLNLNSKREENETFEEYKHRLKGNRAVLKMYKQMGRAQFQQAFPNGVDSTMMAPLNPQNTNTAAE